MEIDKSDMIISLAGHDRGRRFFVVETDETYVWIADGRTRRIEAPKRKRRKHVEKVPRTDSIVAAKILRGERVLNSELRRELAESGQTIMSQNQGG